MEGMSSNPCPRKRKQVPSLMSLKPCNRRITRSQIVGSPPQLVPKPSLKKVKTIHCPVLRNGASPELSIKDLRARARRVFSPAVRDTGCDVKKKMCNGSDLVSGSAVEMCVSVKEEKEKNSIMENLSLGLKDVDMGSSNEKMKNDGENKKNGSISSTAMVRKPLSRGKVYKSPSLFSYRRMLPFLTDMVKEEPCTETDIAAKDSEVDDSINAGSRSLLALTDSKSGQHEHAVEDSNATSPPDHGPILNSDMKHEVKAQGLYDSDKGMPQDVGEVGLFNMEGRIHDNGVTAIDDKIEDRMQTTPPDSNIFSKLEIHYTDVKGQDSFLGCPPSGSRSSNHVPGPTQRNNTNSTTKQVLNPCSRSKIYASSSSFSYRRLLPFLMDVEKSSANKDPSPQCQKQVESSISELLVSSDNKEESYGFQENQQERCMELNVQPNVSAPSPQCLKQVESSQDSELFVSPHSKIKACDFQENQQEKCVELDVQPSTNVPSPQCQKQGERSQSSELLVLLDYENEAYSFQENQLEKCLELNVQANAPSVDGSPHGVCLELSIPNGEMSLGKPSSDRSVDLIELDMLITGQMEIATPQKHAQLNETHKFEGEFHDAGIIVRDAEVNQLVETPFSSLYPTNLPGESGLQFSDDKPVDILSNCTTELVCNEGKVNRIMSVNLDQGSSESGESYNGGSESPTKGILKRNRRGCRGLCSCLNCSSFRLHAERAFEFSRNQMLDAEDVVLMLINELGELRDSLEKSVVDGSDLPDIQLKQARESCKKALAMEQVAKQYLSQMSEDLNAHCRTTPLQRPRVAFSRHVEVKAVGPKTKSAPLPHEPEKTRNGVLGCIR